MHFNVTDHPTVQWTAQQVIEAFPFETAPRYLLRDRDEIYGRDFLRRVAGMGNRYAQHRDHRGRILAWNGSSDQCVGSALTI